MSEIVFLGVGRLTTLADVQHIFVPSNTVQHNPVSVIAIYCTLRSSLITQPDYKLDHDVNT